MRSVGAGRLAVASSFGIESATLLKIVADVDPSIPVLFLDTGWLFPETIAYRDTLVESSGPDGRAHHRAVGRRHWRKRIRRAISGRPIRMPAAICARSSHLVMRSMTSMPGSTAASAIRAAMRSDIPAVEVEGSPAEIQSAGARHARPKSADVQGLEFAASSARGPRLHLARLHALHPPHQSRRLPRAPAAGPIARRPNAASTTACRLIDGAGI